MLTIIYRFFNINIATWSFAIQRDKLELEVVISLPIIKSDDAILIIIVRLELVVPIRTCSSR